MAMSDPTDGNMANLMIQSQESHLLSPEISAAGSDGGGHVEDLRGHSFSSLGEAEVTKRTSLGAKEAAAATTPSFRQRQQTSLRANPSTCSNTTATTASKSKSKSKNKSDPSQTTRTTKSNAAKMAPPKAPQPSSRRRPTPIKVQIVRASSPSTSSSSTNSQLTFSSSQHGDAFTMTLLPMTKIRELCLHASAHARRHLDLVLDGSRLEARDRDGHVFGGHETIAEEVLGGETIFLLEGGLDARGKAKAARAAAAGERPKSRSRERGRLLCLKSLELEGGEERVAKGAYRTPSVSSRASSSSQASKGKKAAEPRMTPSQRALAIAERGLATAAREPVVPKKRPVGAAVKKSLPSPALEKVGECSGADDAPGDDTLVGEPDAGDDDLERTLVAAPPGAVRISTPPPSSPKKQQHDSHHDHHHEVPPNLRDSQLVIPDSQDPFSQSLFSQQSVESQHPAPATSVPELPDAPKADQQHPPRVKATTTINKGSLPTSKPDPYDINNVLSDEEDLLSDESNNSRTIKMAPSVRKLGSATANRKTVAPPPVSLPSPRRAQSNPPSPSRGSKSGVGNVASAKTSTPTKKETPAKKAATPIKVDPSSPAAPLPSSPTTHVAAAIAKGGHPRRDRTPQLPGPGQAVIRVPSSDSEEDDDDLIEDEDLIEAAFLNMSASNKSPTSLPWSQPPLRAASGGEAGVEKQLTPRRRLPDSAAPEVKGGTPMAKLAPSAAGSPKKSPVKKSAPPSPGKKYAQRDFVKASSLITRPSKREEATIVHDSESEYERDNPFVKQEPGNPSTSGQLKKSLMEMPPPPLPRRISSQKSPVKSVPIITSPSKREEATVIQDSSSADSEEEQDVRAVKKEEVGEGLSPFLKRKMAEIPAIDTNPQQEQSNQHEVIELSSGSDSDYDLLEDMLEEEEDRPEPEPEPELPIIDAEPPVQEAQTPLLPRGPAPIDPPPLPEEPMTDPVKIEPDCEEAPPSAQTSKRKRDASQEPDSEEEERERKRLKNRAKKARRREKNREQKAAILLQQQEDELAALEEQRKKIALERAHRRALELEVLVSSPVKRELSLERREEADDDDSGVGSSPPSDETSANAERVGVPLDTDDKNDSLSSKEAEDNRPSWRKLSKMHLSSSPTNGSQNAPPTSTPAIIEAQLQQCVEERFHRRAFDDWAFLESTLGKGLSGGYGHSPLEVHNRVHMGMMHRAHAPLQVFAIKEEPSKANDEPQNEQPEPSAPTGNAAGGDDALTRARSQRSEAPSPKEHRVMEQAQAQVQEQEIKEEEPEHEEKHEETVDERRNQWAEDRKQKKKTRRKLWLERQRKEKRGRLAKTRYHQDFRPSRASSLKQKKQKQKQAQNGQKEMSRDTDV